MEPRELLNRKPMLVLAPDRKDSLVLLLADLGFDPVVRGAKLELLSELAPGLFTAVMVHRRQADGDLLELVRSIRDFDRQTPVVLVGEPAEESYERELRIRRRVYCLPDDLTLLREQLGELFASVLGRLQRDSLEVAAG